RWPRDWSSDVCSSDLTESSMLARFFIDRPVLAWVISIVIVLMGLIASGLLPIAQYPDVTPPTVRVTAFYPGASAQVVADTVAARSEERRVGKECRARW